MSLTSKDRAIKGKVEKHQQKLAPDAVNMAMNEPADRLANVPPRARDVMDEQFPTDRLTAKDERDKIMDAKMRLTVPGQPGVTPFGKMTLSDADLKWLEKKQKAVEAANFQQWFAQWFDRANPADKAKAKKLCPNFYTQREDLLKRQCKNLFDVAKIKLNGIESYSDLLKQYELESGRLDVGPLNHLLNPESDPQNSNSQGKFRRGLLSPWRVFGEEAYPLDGRTGVYQRGYEQASWSGRNFDVAGTVELGAQTGFPPFNSQETNQKTGQWWQLLQQTP